MMTKWLILLKTYPIPDESAQTIPYFRPKWSKLIPYFRPKWLKKTIPFRVAHTYIAEQTPPPPPQAKNALQIMSLAAYVSE